MLFIKSNLEYENPVFESEFSDCDVAADARELELECAMFRFECVHATIEAYHAVLEDDASGANSNDNSSSDSKDERGMFDKLKDKLKGMKDKVVSFIKKIWNKLKTMFNKIVYWFTTRLTPASVFLKKYGEAASKVDKFEVKHDYSAELMILAGIITGSKMLGNIVKTFFDGAKDMARAIKAQGITDLKSATQASANYQKSSPTGMVGDKDQVDAAGQKAQQLEQVLVEAVKNNLPKELEKIIDVNKIHNINDIVKAAKDNFEGIKNEALKKYNEQKYMVSGKQLCDALRVNEPSVNLYKGFSAGIGNLLKSIEIDLAKPDGSRTLSISVNPVYKLLSFISSLVSMCIVQSQKLILSLRADIKHCAGGTGTGSSDSDKKDGGDKKEEAKPAAEEGNKESAYFGGMLDVLGVID